VDAVARIEVVERENDTLRERVAQLEAALVEAGGFLVPVEWRLTPSEARVFCALLSRPLLTKDALMAALYHNLGRDEADQKIVDVFICKLRKKLKPFGIAIETVWGQGYYLPPATRSQLRSEQQQRVAA
jgi:DNA-binding response OmpR family regulator